MLLPIEDTLEVDMRIKSLEPSSGSVCLSEKDANQSIKSSQDKGIGGEFFAKTKSQHL